MFFEVLLYLFLVGATYISGGSPICFQWPLFFSPYSISFPRNYNLTLLVIDISASVFILLIFHFYLGLFLEVLYVFNFIFKFQFIKYYILQIGPHYLDL